jgi:formate dehydrogenase
MIESIEGKRGMPRLRPPYVAQVGLFGHPTLEHNMETLHWVRDIVERGPEWFNSQGRNGRKGLRSFSVSGRVNKPGVHIAPAGISLRELIDEYCGGMLSCAAIFRVAPRAVSCPRPWIICRWISIPCKITVLSSVRRPLSCCRNTTA